MTDALGSLVRFTILPGGAHDPTRPTGWGADAVLADLDCGALIEGRAAEVDSLLADLEARGIRAVIPARKRRTVMGSLTGIRRAGGTRSGTSSRNARSSGGLRHGQAGRW
ncbi:MAG: hypothetical protein OXC91_01890 [Rhodobacteraceae bacterium]|nr:hypothetical protein [Paracoccaceae bacterium]